MTGAPADDPVLAALDELLAVARTNISSWIAVMERVERVRQLRRDGVRYRDMDVGVDTPPVIEVVSNNQERLVAAAAAFRRATAQQLLAEGMTIADIARAFGVSRQRISSLLKGEREEISGNHD